MTGCRFVPAAAVVALMACSVPEPEIVPGVSRELARQRAATVSGLHYTLDFVIPLQSDADIDGHVVIAFDLLDATTALTLDFTGGADRIRSVSSNGESAAWRVEREHLVIPATALTRGRNEVEIEFVAGSAALNRNPNYLYSLFVPDRARTAFPLFDQPDLKATFELTLTVPSGWRALSNAAVESVSPSGLSTTHRFRRSALISPYVFAFVAGQFESITRERNGRSMTMLHRETDAAIVERNVEAIFDLHAAAIDWLEEHTGIDYPFAKLDFALIPAFQYNGMEHAGAILYRARSLLLDEAPSDMDLLGRASLIAHETAHMWFGNLVTMEWFDDVWLKEVFANFMAAKIVNPSFPAIDHELSFLVRHAPAAYSVDRTAGANPIRQPLPNLDEAGQLYGPIIYNKAPIMMRQLESLVGEERFQAGLREYLDRYAFANASWSDLIDILDATTDDDLGAWSEVWVNTPGRPVLQTQSEPASGRDAGHVLLQNDPAGSGRVWPQRFEVADMGDAAARRTSVLSSSRSTPLDELAGDSGERLVFNADGRGYGLFPADARNLFAWDTLGEVERAAELINLYENMLVGGEPAPSDYFTALLGIAERETNQLLLGLELDQLTTIFWKLLPTDARLEVAAELETTLWQSMLEQTDESSRKVRFDAFAEIATTPEALRNLHDIWVGQPIDRGSTPFGKRPHCAGAIARLALADRCREDLRRPACAYGEPGQSAQARVHSALPVSRRRSQGRVLCLARGRPPARSRTVGTRGARQPPPSAQNRAVGELRAPESRTPRADPVNRRHLLPLALARRDPRQPSLLERGRDRQRFSRRAPRLPRATQSQDSAGGRSYVAGQCADRNRQRGRAASLGTSPEFSS